ncbi:tyrosine-type recombinase/integrase [Shewanella sp. SG44-2]|uniref:integrase domain-containing protein n=1 Tax=Shewanella sp. SG44-2 TaxID=2760962 RepID=UPI0016014FBD|nr:integrase domain-containing protein [Shewanella sp. SG44-2]MBB1427632.1 tyrosine-type recombinase/integrase [Shewanella sp. SG44-2]
MANTTKLLTATAVANAKPRSKEYNLSDGRGLSLRVKTTGSKFWLLNYSRPVTTKRTNLGLGTYPDVPLAEARKRREAARELLAQGIDPQHHQQQHKAAIKTDAENTLRSVTDTWFVIKKQKVSKNHGQKLYRRLELYLFPALGETPISALTAPQVIQVLKPAEAKGYIETCKRVISWLNEVMTFAVNTGLIHSNPLIGIAAAFGVPEKRQMPTLKPAELPEFIEVLTYSNIKITTRCLIEFQLHTMTRPAEAAMAKWTEIDLDKQLWTIPAERMKMKREHIIPLTPHVLALLKRLQLISSHLEYIFPSDRNPNTHTNTQTANMAIRRMGYKGRLVAHGLRALASTTLNEQGFDAELIEVSLAHVDKNTVRAAYNRADYIERRRELMCWWSNHIQPGQAR